jgi:hypothetical protein
MATTTRRTPNRKATVVMTACNTVLKRCPQAHERENFSYQQGNVS